jgi:hypothetical protein
MRRLLLDRGVTHGSPSSPRSAGHLAAGSPRAADEREASRERCGVFFVGRLQPVAKVPFRTPAVRVAELIAMAWGKRVSRYWCHAATRPLNRAHAQRDLPRMRGEGVWGGLLIVPSPAILRQRILRSWRPAHPLRQAIVVQESPSRPRRAGAGVAARACVSCRPRHVPIDAADRCAGSRPRLAHAPSLGSWPNTASVPLPPPPAHWTVPAQLSPFVRANESCDQDASRSASSTRRLSTIRERRMRGHLWSILAKSEVFTKKLRREETS